MKKGTVLAITAAIVMSTVLSCDPAKATGTASAEAKASVAAAEAVQKEIATIKENTDKAVELLTTNDVATLDADDGALRTVARDALELVTEKLETTEETGLQKLSEKAVEAARAVKSSATAEKAVTAAQKVKTDLDKDTTSEGSTRKKANYAFIRFGPIPIGNDSTLTDVVTNAQASQSAIDALKKLADDAVAAAKAVK